MKSFVPQITRPKTTWTKLATVGVVGAELLGWGFNPEGARDFHVTLLEGLGKAAVWVADAPLESAACGITSALPDVNFNTDCVQNFFSRLGDDDNSVSGGGGGSAETPAGGGESVDIDLAARMERAGYSCANLRLVEAVSDDSPIGLLIKAGTSSNVANAAYENGAFSELVVNVGENVRVGDCA